MSVETFAPPSPQQLHPHVQPVQVEAAPPVQEWSLDRSVKAPGADASDGYDYSADHTVAGKYLAEKRGLLKEQLFAGRPVITRDTYPIDGHVDIRSWQAGDEATVVDSKKYPKHYETLSGKFLEKISGTQWQQGEDMVPKTLKAVFDSVSESMVYDLPFVDKISADMRSKNAEHRKVDLSLYLAAGKGVCRHMALAAAWLGGEMESRGFLPAGGKFTAEVNQSTKGNGAHEWARYTSPNGEIYILDPAQKFFGTLAEAVKRAEGKPNAWEYFLDEGEKKAFMAKMAGQAMLDGAGLPPPSDKEKWWDRADDTTVRRLSRRDPNTGQMHPVTPPNPQLIDSVPKTPEDFAALEDRQRKEQNAPIEARLREIDVAFAELTNGLSESDLSNLYTFAFNMMNKRDAQKRDDGQGSIYYEGQAGQAYRRLSKTGLDKSGSFLQLMQLRDNLSSKLK
jgi:hypothetical protein